MDLESALNAFFRSRAPLEGGDKILVAFSGGSDSTALLLGLGDLATRRSIRLIAAHIDHGLDPESPGRAEDAGTAAQRLGHDLVVERHPVRARRRGGESLEMAARRVRYRALDGLAARFDVRYIATGHHRDDQAETVLLRLAAGHGLSGLVAIPPRRDNVVRPLLGISRNALRSELRVRGIKWIEDPSNDDLTTPRNHLRRRILPHLESTSPDLPERLADLAAAARGAHRVLARKFDRLLRPELESAGLRLSRRSLESLPRGLVALAVVHLLRACGEVRKPSRRALAHVENRIEIGVAVGTDLGGGWRLEEAGAGRLRLFRVPEATPAFAYTVTMPGEVHLSEVKSSLRLRSGRVEPWMFQGSRHRAGLSLPRDIWGELTVRNRRPGDRVQPLGSSRRQKLKDLLIEHAIPRHERDRLPLLCHSRRILWVPGVTIDHETRIRGGSKTCVAEIIPDE